MFSYRYAYLTGLLLLGYQVNGAQVTNDPSQIANKQFSFVVVGGGTAGLALANRLSEDPKHTVLVLEAGPSTLNNAFVNDPGMANNPGNLSWQYPTTPQINGQSLVVPQGFATGGCSSINGLQWGRGTQGQYDSIEALGNPGWNFASFVKYSQKAESFRPPSASQTSVGHMTFLSSVHGFNGPVIAGFPDPYLNASTTDAIVKTAHNVIPGLVDAKDFASGNPNGVGRWVFSLKPGSDDGAQPNVRSSSAISYIFNLAPTERPNLTVLTGHRGTRILWDSNDGSKGGSPKATGVEFIGSPSPTTSTGPLMSVKVDKEVIVSAGSVGSPVFLEHSGVGDAAILKKFNIPVKVNLSAVGTNLQDQVFSSLVYGVAVDNNLPNTPASFTSIFANLEQVLGDKAKSFGEALIQSIPKRAAAIVAAGGSTSLAGMKKSLTEQAKHIIDQKAPVVEITIDQDLSPGVSLIIPILLMPQYRGFVHINSSDPTQFPLLNPNYLQSPAGFSFDVDILGNGTILGRTIGATDPLHSLWPVEIAPGPTVNSSEGVRQYVLSSPGATMHLVGSCSMMPRELGGVVDPSLKVYGTQNVRDVDSSIIPIQISTHPSFTVYGVAEKAADIIKSSYPN